MSSNPPTDTPTATAAATTSAAVRRRGAGRWTLRARLVATITVLLALACVVVGVTTAVTLDRALYGHLDDQLEAAASRTPHAFDPPARPAGGVAALRQCAPQPPGGFPPGQAVGTLAARVCDGAVTDVRILAEAGEAEPDLTGPVGTLGTVPADGEPRTVDLGDVGAYRVVARDMPNGAVLVTGLPLADTHATLRLVTGVVGGATLLVVLSAGLAGAVMVRRELRPLSRVAATAAAVSGSTLDRGEVALTQRVADADTDPRTETGKVGAALNRMLDHVGQALAARHRSEIRVRQFVADAGHELRTPLAAIRGYAELARRTGEPVPPQVAQALDRVESEAQRMTGLVEDLLLLARLDAGRPLLREPVDVTRLVVDAVADAHATAPGHDWRLELPPEPVQVTGDRDRLHQLLANLLANARAHTPEGTTVTVAVGVSDDTVLLTVADNGPGIPPQLLPHVCERFARGDTSRSRAAGSTGLGLAIVQAIAVAHQGTVDISSGADGTAVTVHLPHHRARAGDTGAG